MTTLRNILIGLMILISARLSAEPIGDIISYQGKVLNPDGTPMTGPQTAKITIKENGTQKVYQEIPVILIGGVFNTFISIGTLTFDPQAEYKIKVEVGGNSTEEKIASVPVAKSVGTGGVSTDALKDGAVTQPKAPFALAGPAAGYRIETGHWSGVPTPFGSGSPITGYVRLTFSRPFEYSPVVVVTPLFKDTPTVTFTLGPADTTGVNVFLTPPDGWPAGREIEIYWIAVGK